MHKIIDDTGNRYDLYPYTEESEYERVIVENASLIFGENGIYFDIKKRIGKPKKGAAIPDGYLLDLTFHTEPRLYLIEVELSSHEIYAHIGNQLLRFGIASEMDKHKIKKLLIEEINNNRQMTDKLNSFFEKSSWNNINELLDKVIFDKKPTAIVVINQESEELQNVLAQFTMAVDIIEFQTFVCGDKTLHKFKPFHDDIEDNLPENNDADELDTIIVPAMKDGFQDVFLGEECWYAIRISSSMIDKIKYIAAYCTAPDSAITHYAEVDKILKYQDSNKYIVYFKKDTLSKVNSPIKLDDVKFAPRSPRYTSYKKLLKAKKLTDLWR